MSDLFEIEPTLSPRLKWIYSHGIATWKSEFDHAGPVDEDEVWICEGRLKGQGRGATEDDAIVSYAKKTNLKLWNE